jgi:hypothetical protein
VGNYGQFSSLLVLLLELLNCALWFNVTVADVTLQVCKF